MSQHGYTTAQQNAFGIAERVSSAFSFVGISIIIGTFVAYPQLRKPVHRLIFLTSLGNGLYITATMIGTSALSAGADSPLCIYQAFTITMFQLSDVMWNFSIAINVYLTVFRNFDQSRLKVLEWRYFAINYGLPFVVALSLIFAGNADKGKVYGPSTIWCTITSKWDVLRLALHYGPVWAMIVASFAVYVAAGVSIWRRDRQLHRFASSSESRPGISVDQSVFTIFDRIGQDTSQDFKMTEVQISSETSSTPDEPLSPALAAFPRPRNSLGISRAPLPVPTRPEPVHKGPEREVNEDTKELPYKPYTVVVETGLDAVRGHTSTGTRPSTRRDRHYASLTYMKYSFLFFIALIVTWLPASINRIYGIVHPDQPNWGLSMGAATVLPLMGFWNTVIFVVTSWPTLRALWFGDVVSPARMIPGAIKLRSRARQESNSSIEDLNREESTAPSVREASYHAS